MTRRLESRAIETIRFLKAQMSSSAATGVDWLVVTVLVFGSVYYVTAVVIGAIAGAVTDFSIKKWWVFRTDLRMGQTEAFRYALVSASSALLNGAFVYGCVEGLRLAKPVGVALTSLIVGFAWNYPMHRLFVFSTTAASTTPEPP